jgi:hypothetical protein
MSKKNKKGFGYNISPASAGTPALSHQAEYLVIKHDLIKVVILNVFYLALILVLFFGNQKTHFLDNWFAKVLHF